MGGGGVKLYFMSQFYCSSTVSVQIFITGKHAECTCSQNKAQRFLISHLLVITSLYCTVTLKQPLIVLFSILKQPTISLLSPASPLISTLMPVKQVQCHCIRYHLAHFLFCDIYCTQLRGHVHTPPILFSCTKNFDMKTGCYVFLKCVCTFYVSTGDTTLPRGHANKRSHCCHETTPRSLTKQFW